MSLQDQAINILLVKCELLRSIIKENKDDSRVVRLERQLQIIEEELKFREDRDKDQDKDAEHLIVRLRSLDLNGSTKLER